MKSISKISLLTILCLSLAIMALGVLPGLAQDSTTVTDTSTIVTGAVSFGADGKPKQNPDGSYNLLLAVISTGRVTDVEPKKVVHWSQPRQETIDGKPTWVIDVTYPTNSIFGPMDVASHAQIRDNQLVRWIYDSGEPVP